MADIIGEEQLLKRAQTTSEGFAELFDKCYDRVYAYAYRRVRVQQVAEDIAECVFEDALRGIDRLRWEGKPIIAWLFRIASRRIADHFRAPESFQLAEEMVGSERSHPDDVLAKSERQLEVRAALVKLAKADQEIIRLSFFDELEPFEISALLRISTNNVYVRLHRALGRLEALLSENGG